MAFMIFCFVLCSIWDGVTTGLGVASIIGATDPLGYGMCVAAGFVVLGFCVGTKTIMSRYTPVFLFMRILWLGAVAFDGYTSFVGNAKYIVLRNTVEAGKGLLDQLGSEQILVVAVLTILVSGAPILVGYLSDDTGS